MRRWSLTDLSEIINALRILAKELEKSQSEPVTFSLEKPKETLGGAEMSTGYVTLHLVVRDPQRVAAFRRALVAKPA